jgi:hypothetical protein
MDKTSINLVDLDFESLKTDFRNFLRSQDQFKDYDFDGPNMAILLELLTYNTFKNAFFLNMVLSESFIDSAQLRDSLASHSTQLNYLPRSRRSAMARLRVEFKSNRQNQPYTIPKGSSFATQVNNETFIFSIPETLVVSSANTSFAFTTDVYEGVYQKDVFIVRNTNEILRYKLSSPTLDTTSVAVTVFEDGDSIGQHYNFATNMLGINERSRVFFMQSTENGHYEIIFGDNLVGRKPKQGARIVVDYRVTEAEKANGAKYFSINFDPTARNGESDLLDTPTVHAVIPSSNGRERESNESIRYYAPRHFQVQERAIVESDYEIMLKTQFPEINAVSAFGGEELDPPQYGRVFIAVDIENVEGFPAYKQREYFNFIRAKNSKTIEPIFVNPEFTFIDVKCLAKYNINVTDQSPERIKTLIADAIDNYSDENLNDFKVSLRYSRLQSIIDNADPSIISNELELTAFKKINPEPEVPQNYVLDFNFRLSQDIHSHTDNYPIIGHETIVSSSRFRWNNMTCVIHDDGRGILRIMRVDQDTYTKIMNIGRVNYRNGRVTLNRFLVQRFEGASIKIIVRPDSKDISSNKNTIMRIDPENVNITVRAMRL